MFSPARDEFLVATHATLTAKQQAERLGRPYSAVVARRMALAKRGAIALAEGLYARTKARPWTAEEERYLREHVGVLPYEEIGEKLGRSANGIIVRCKRARILRRPQRRINLDGFNALDVARILAVDIHAVTHNFIRWGLLKAQRHPFLTTHEGLQWLIRRQDLVDFLIDYPWQYDRERITDLFFRRVAEEAWARDPLYTTIEAARLLGFGKQHAVSSFLQHTAPKFVPRSRLVIRRRGNPRGTGKSLAGMHAFVPLSTIRAIQASGWLNVRKLADDPNALTAERATRLLWKDPDRPPYLTRSRLLWRLYRFYESGAIPTGSIAIANRKPWRVARPEDVLAMKQTLFARATATLRLTEPRRGLLERHDPSWLERPADLARALADGRLATLFRVWWEAERTAARELRWAKTRRWALVTKHVARVLEQLGPKTTYRGRAAIYHRMPHAAGLVHLPLADARRHGLRECEHCEFERRFKVRATGRGAKPMPTCAECETTFRRGPGRPPKVERCARCRRTERRAA